MTDEYTGDGEYLEWWHTDDSAKPPAPMNDGHEWQRAWEQAVLADAVLVGLGHPGPPVAPRLCQVEGGWVRADAYPDRPRRPEDERDDARRWAARWKSAAGVNRVLADIEGKRVEELEASRDDARRWARAWRRAAQSYRDLLPVGLGDAWELRARAAEAEAVRLRGLIEANAEHHPLCPIANTRTKRRGCDCWVAEALR